MSDQFAVAECVFQLLGGRSGILLSVRVGHESGQRGSLRKRDSGRAVFQPQTAGHRDGPRRQVRDAQEELRRSQSTFRRHCEGDAVVESGGRHGDFYDRQQPHRRRRADAGRIAVVPGVGEGLFQGRAWTTRWWLSRSDAADGAKRRTTHHGPTQRTPETHRLRR